MGRLQGDADLRRNLAALARAPGRGLDATCVAALTPMKDQTEANAKRYRQPRQPRGGHLDQGVVIAKVEGSGSFFRVFWISFRKRARFLAHLVEFGTAPHWQPNWRGGWMHPGARPKPFFRPAFEEKKQDVATIFGQRMWASMVSNIRGVRK